MDILKNTEIKKISLHNHTFFSDGENSPEEMVEKAIELGFQVFGISDHSYTWFDEEYCMKKEAIEDYKKTINALKEKYKGKIDLKLCIEQDYYSDEPTCDYDYVIGSVHYIKIQNDVEDTPIFIPVDESIKKAADILRKAADDYFKKDIYLLAEEYFRCVGDVVNKTGADIVGHFDVISKCNKIAKIFDEHNERYVAAWQKAVNKLIEHDVIFEINISPLRRKYKDEPYPSYEMQEYIKKKGGRFIISGDCHSKEEMDFEF